MEKYYLVQWPESQEIMEESWFNEEAIFAFGSEEKIGSCAYFIPCHLYDEYLILEDGI